MENKESMTPEVNNEEIMNDTQKTIEEFKNSLINNVIENIKALSEDEIKNLMTQDRDYGVTDKVILPSRSLSEAESIYDKITDLNANDKQHFTEKEKQALWITGKGFNSSLDDYKYIDNNKTNYHKFTSNGDYALEYTTKNGDSIKLKSLDFLTILNKTPDDKKINEDIVLSVFKSIVSSGEVTKIPLWHSGFTVDINPPTVRDIVNTQNAINDDMIKIGNATINLVYSNISVVSNKHIINLFLSLINKYTLNVEKNELLNHISVLDIPIITLGILSAMYPQGASIVTSCSNTLQMDGDKIECDFVATGKLDFKKLLIVDKPKIKSKVDNYVSNLVKIASQSVTVSEIEKYKNELYKSDLSKPVIKVPNDDKEFILELKIPSITEYLEECEYYLEELDTRITEAMGSDYEDKDTITSFVISMTYITIYSSFIKSIIINNNDGKDLKLETRNFLFGALTALSSVGNDPKIINSVIIDYINDVTCGVIGIKNYICPNCSKKHTDNDSKVTLLALDKLFFTQATLRTLQSVQQIKN